MNPLNSIGTGELILVLVIALIFLGPERLPEIARNVGKSIRQFRDVLQGMSSEFGEELSSVQEISKDIREGIQAVQEVRDLPKDLVSNVTRPLMETVSPVKKAVEETQEAMAESVSLTASQIETIASQAKITEPVVESGQISAGSESDISTEDQILVEGDEI